MKKHIEKEINRIADAIVELVERADGPVTLAEVEREVAGFAANESLAWAYWAGGERLIWAGMTRGGLKALQKVMNERRVAVQLITRVPYLLEGRVIEDETWLPIALLPARAANLDTATWLIRAPQGHCDYAIKRKAAEGNIGYRPLTPGPVRYTADQFSL